MFLSSECYTKKEEKKKITGQSLYTSSLTFYCYGRSVSCLFESVYSILENEKNKYIYSSTCVGNAGRPNYKPVVKLLYITGLMVERITKMHLLYIILHFYGESVVGLWIYSYHSEGLIPWARTSRRGSKILTF